MNMIQQVGDSYFSTRFGGCIFVGENGKAHFIDHVRGSSVTCREIDTPKQSRLVQVPCDFFQSFKFLSVPALGWRSRHRGRMMVRLVRTNTSYTRGVTVKNFSRHFADHTEYMFNLGKLNRADVELPTSLAHLVVNPEHMTMAEGLEGLNKGSIMGFTNSASIAVIPENNSKYNIYCESAIVADVTPEGEVTVRPGCDNFEQEILR